MKTRIFNIHALSALHVGTGQGIGLIDLPIARERATNLPIIPGSGIKGVLRDELRPDQDDATETWLALFGPETQDAETDPFAGALMIGDAFLLALPVRSLAGTFAWVSCPWVLKRYQRDLQMVQDAVFEVPEVDEANPKVTADSLLRINNDQVVLEDLQFGAARDDAVDTWADFIARRVFPDDENWQAHFKQRFILLSDDEFNHLSEQATEVRARIRIKEDTRTVAKGALWYEENLPVESLFWGVLGTTSSRKPKYSLDAEQLLQSLDEQLLNKGQCRMQLGGNASIGRGQVRFIMQEEK